MAFEFRLKKVLKYRQDQKELAKEELSNRRRELDLLQDELQGLHGKGQALLNFYRERQAKAIDVRLLRNIENYRSHLQECTERKQQECRQSSSKVEEQRQVVLGFWKNCQVLKKLQEKSFMDYQQEEKQKEQYFHDELSLRLYLRHGR
ncbi:MAG: flagellar export protein FliJ [Firmicutes bacterium]|nr:flagellar export protein FliJ [Bacillota bacterium]